MDTSKYWAKSDKVTTLAIHNAALREALDKLYELGYIEKKMYELLKIACEYHDLGKINEIFQARMKNKKLHFDLEKEIPHNVLSLFFVDSERVNKINPEDKKNYVRMLFAILYHHYNSDLMRMVSSSKRQLENIFPQDAFSDIQDEIYSLPIGIEEEISEVIGLKDEKAVKMKGLLHKCDYAASGHYPIEFRNDFLLSGLEYLLMQWNNPADQEKQEIQSAEEFALSEQDKNENERATVDWNSLQYFCKEKQNQNIIVVAQTGMGKTEAGLLWIGNHKGFFVLPIRTAINAIYNRLRKDMLVNSDKIDEQVGILHSEQLEYYTKNIEGSDEDIYEYVKRGKQFSLPLNISTLDQLFDFIFQYPGYELKLATLSYSRIVIDEIQMYNAELLAYLIFGLEKIVKMGGKVAILTATLPPFVKELLEQHLNIPKENQEVFIDDKKARHHIKVCDKKINAEDIVKLYLKNKEACKSNPHKGNKILVVCNKIKTAQKIFDDVNELIKAKYDKEEIHIFHSRFIKEDREKLEKEIIEFGQTGNKSEDVVEKGGIWITTSVVEASLDIDFDYLVTELQDLCSLLQRMGRCNRKGLKSVFESNCYIYLQIDSADLIGKTKRTRRRGKEKVYGFIDATLYELSKKAISEHEGILTESQKQEMLQKYFTTENIQNSYFMNSFKKTYKYVSEIRPYSYQKNEKKLREIVTETIIPSPVYEEKSTQILECVQKLKQADLSVIQRQKLRNQIMKYTVNVPYYHWKSYQDALNSKKTSGRKAKYYEPIQIGKYEKIKVMECNYDKKGYSPIEWTKKTEDNE